jgi:type IV pilus assembly protein PilW
MSDINTRAVLVQVSRSRPSIAKRRLHHQGGLTLVELLVALGVSLVVSLAAVSALIMSRQGFSTVDAGSQLRDNARFSADLIQRIAVQSGFKDFFYATQNTPTATEISADYNPNVMGFENSTSSSSDPINSATARLSSVVGYGSDVLVLRYQATETYPGSGIADGSMIDCNGNTISTTGALNRNDRAASVFHVALSQGEPTLMCSSVSTGGTINAANPLVRGVELFQTLYGVNTSSAANTAFVASPCPPPATNTLCGIPVRYFRASQMTVAGNTTQTNNNWRLVRSIRIGLLIRGPANSQQGFSGPATFYPFGMAKESSTGTAGFAMSSTTDINSRFTAPVDGRLRQTYTFTVHLRNDQDSALNH